MATIAKYRAVHVDYEDCPGSSIIAFAVPVSGAYGFGKTEEEAVFKLGLSMRNEHLWLRGIPLDHLGEQLMHDLAYYEAHWEGD